MTSSRSGLTSNRAAPPAAPADRADRAAPVATPRRPRQERGQRRVEAILDAAAALIAEGGASGLTMQAIASRSRTASGSLYHFFPDRESVLCGLAERHVRQVRQVVAQTRERLSAGSTPVAVATVVDRMLDPLLAYVATHPDFLAVMEATARPGQLGPADADLDAAVQAAAGEVVRACVPGASGEERAVRGAAVIAAVEGAMARAARAAAVRERRALVRELKRMLVAYLER